MSNNKVYVCKLRVYKGYDLMEDELKWIYGNKDKALQKMEWFVKKYLEYDKEAKMLMAFDGGSLAIVKPGNVHENWERHYMVIERDIEDCEE